MSHILFGCFVFSWSIQRRANLAAKKKYAKIIKLSEKWVMQKRAEKSFNEFMINRFTAVEMCKCITKDDK